MTRDVYMTRAFVSLAIGGIIALATALATVRGVIGSRSTPAEPYRRDEDPGSFWAMAIGLGLVAAYFIISGAINFFRFFEYSN
jgi:hypothetical protein